MATLTTEQKIEVYREFMQVAGAFSTSMSNKNDLKAACLAVYDWFIANQTGLVAALPSNARPANSGLTAKQLAQLVSLILRKMFMAEV